jgi:hypothetical protein
MRNALSGRFHAADVPDTARRSYGSGRAFESVSDLLGIEDQSHHFRDVTIAIRSGTRRTIRCNRRRVLGLLASAGAAPLIAGYDEQAPP